MGGPSLTILGVYRPVIDEQTWREQWQVTGDDEATREHFRKLVLVEAIVEGLNGHLDFSKFGKCNQITLRIGAICRSDTTRGCSPLMAKL